jgi:predicted branched-subunit amino acid permease
MFFSPYNRDLKYSYIMIILTFLFSQKPVKKLIQIGFILNNRHAYMSCAYTSHHQI